MGKSMGTVLVDSFDFLTSYCNVDIKLRMIVSATK